MSNGRLLVVNGWRLMSKRCHQLSLLNTQNLLCCVAVATDRTVAVEHDGTIFGLYSAKGRPLPALEAHGGSFNVKSLGNGVAAAAAIVMDPDRVQSVLGTALTTPAPDLEAVSVLSLTRFDNQGHRVSGVRRKSTTLSITSPSATRPCPFLGHTANLYAPQVCVF